VRLLLSPAEPLNYRRKPHHPSWATDEFWAGEYAKMLLREGLYSYGAAVREASGRSGVGVTEIYKEMRVAKGKRKSAFGHGRGKRGATRGR